jgi:hypothetical protein
VIYPNIHYSICAIPYKPNNHAPDHEGKGAIAVKIHLLPWNLSICQPGSREIPDLDIFFLCQTDEEISLVCWTEHVPEKTLSREDGWKAFRVDGPLDFSLIGIIHKPFFLGKRNNQRNQK